MNRYLVMLVRSADFNADGVPAHVAFLDQLRIEGRLELSGPFADQSGGAYLLRAADRDQALATTRLDPACSSGSWAITVHEWHAR